jgi:hypothetical protein
VAGVRLGWLLVVLLVAPTACAAWTMGGHDPGQSFASSDAGPRLDEVAWRTRLRDDLDNIRAAVRWSLDATDTARGEVAVRIAAALAPYEFEVIYGAWWDRIVRSDGQGAVQRSAERYVAALGTRP